MPRIINGVAYSEDYEDLVGPIPKAPVATKVVTTDTGTTRTVAAPVENTAPPVDNRPRVADGSGASAR